jgi:hypothetical protein
MNATQVTCHLARVDTHASPTLNAMSPNLLCLN